MGITKLTRLFSQFSEAKTAVEFQRALISMPKRKRMKKTVIGILKLQNAIYSKWLHANKRNQTSGIASHIPHTKMRAYISISRQIQTFKSGLNKINPYRYKKNLAEFN